MQCLQVDEAFGDPFYWYLCWAQAPLVKMVTSESFPTVNMAPKYLNMFPLLLTEISIRDKNIIIFRLQLEETTRCLSQSLCLWLKTNQLYAGAHR